MSNETDAVLGILLAIELAGNHRLHIFKAATELILEKIEKKDDRDSAEELIYAGLQIYKRSLPLNFPESKTEE